MTAHRDPDRLIRAFLDEGLTELPNRAYDAVRAEIDLTRQWAVLGPWREPRVSNYARFAIAAVAILAVVAVGAYVLPRLGGIAAPAATPTAEPSATAQTSTTAPAPTAQTSTTAPAPTTQTSTTAPAPTTQTSTTAPAATAPPVVVSARRPANGWIAYSTTGVSQRGDFDALYPGDIYLVREGVQPILVAAGVAGTTRRVCPVFSPDGTMLAFGVTTPGVTTGTSIPPTRAVVVVGVDANGSITEVVTIPAAQAIDQPAPCPRWSVDGTRVAFLEERTVVVRALDGSSPASADGDPVVGDFVHDEVEPLISPTGDWIAQRHSEYPGACQLAVARSDGSDSRIVVDTQGDWCFYSIAAWSPDGQRVLLMEDVSGMHFTMHAASIDPSEAMVTIVASVRANDGRSSRSWPGRGDVSWQPVYP